MRQFEVILRTTDGRVLRRFETFASSKSGANRRAHEAAETLPPGTSWTAEIEEI